MQRRGVPWALYLVLVIAGMTVWRGADALAAERQNDCHQVESERFVFHSDPWINLHHFLFQWARNVPERKPGDRRRPVDVTEAAQLEDLPEEERQVWERAVEFYREQLIGGSLLTDRRLLELRGKLATISCSAAGDVDDDTEVWTVLGEAMPVYDRRWWPQHHAGNMTWIARLMDRLTSSEVVLAKRLAEAYDGEWPSERIRVDVVAYANWAGAYTSNHPDHMTVSSIGYPSLSALEILFHEVSHASFFEQRILGQIAAAFGRRGVDPPHRLSHAIQFATPAELVRGALDGQDRDSFKPVAERVYERGSFREGYRIVLKYWKPFLDGLIDRSEALDRIAEEFAQSSEAGTQ